MALPAAVNASAVLLPAAAAATWQHASVASAPSNTRMIPAASAFSTNGPFSRGERRGSILRGRKDPISGRLVGAAGECGWGRGRGGRSVRVRADGGTAATETTAGSSGFMERREEEIAAMVEEVMSILARDHPSLPVGEYGRDDDTMLRWFLKDRKYKVEPTVEKLAKAIKWRHEFGVAALTAADVAEEGATGKAFLHEHADVDGRPVIVVVAAKHFPDSSRLVYSQQLCSYLIERAIERLPEGTEQFRGIFDLRGFTAKNTDLAFVGFMIDVFFNYYPKRLHQVLFVDAPFIFQPGWKVMKPLLKSYADLVVFCKAEEVRDKYFQPGQAPGSFF
ncbi:hypothetical protein CLOM_g1812 [Closterium sp. NIES-68]|nr:hypothetical protein CLOM_g1812 [Closterium sp. NIES-68]GJP75193.1 hypothetical protein CLOP_g5668 [Closterium sp. NIES-67]